MLHLDLHPLFAEGYVLLLHLLLCRIRHLVDDRVHHEGKSGEDAERDEEHDKPKELLESPHLVEIRLGSAIQDGLALSFCAPMAKALELVLEGLTRREDEARDSSGARVDWSRSRDDGAEFTSRP